MARAAPPAFSRCRMQVLLPEHLPGGPPPLPPAGAPRGGRGGREGARPRTPCCGICGGGAVKAAPQRLAVIGCGHVGLVTAGFFAEQGNVVAGIDVNARHVATLNAGRIPFWEPRLAELTSTNLASGRLSFTTSFEQGLAGCSAAFFCVDTPGTSTGAADLRHIREAARQ